MHRGRFWTGSVHPRVPETIANLRLTSHTYTVSSVGSLFCISIPFFIALSFSLIALIVLNHFMYIYLISLIHRFCFVISVYIDSSLKYLYTRNQWKRNTCIFHIFPTWTCQSKFCFNQTFVLYIFFEKVNSLYCLIVNMNFCKYLFENKLSHSL